MKPCPICNGRGLRYRKADKYWLLKCRDCGFIYADASEQEIEQINFKYDEFAEEHYGKVQTGFDVWWFDRISAQLSQKRPGIKVLDVGCGNGILLQQFQKYGCICYGSDPSPWARIYAERYGYTLLDRIEETDIKAGTFDIITCTSTLEHIARPLEHVQRIMELLKPGGMAYFTVPNYGSLPIKLHLVKGRLVDPPGHCNYFTARTLRKLFLQSDHKDVIAQVHVRSYGIPEIHYLYQRLRFPKQEVHGTQTCRDKAKVLHANWLKGALVIFLGLFNYWSGMPFGLGDKLEARVRKISSCISE